MQEIAHWRSKHYRLCSVSAKESFLSETNCCDSCVQCRYKGYGRIQWFVSKKEKKRCKRLEIQFSPTSHQSPDTLKGTWREHQLEHLKKCYKFLLTLKCVLGWRILYRKGRNGGCEMRIIWPVGLYLAVKGLLGENNMTLQWSDEKEVSGNLNVYT